MDSTDTTKMAIWLAARISIATIMLVLILPVVRRLSTNVLTVVCPSSAPLWILECFQCCGPSIGVFKLFLYGCLLQRVLLCVKCLIFPKENRCGFHSTYHGCEEGEPKLRDLVFEFLGLGALRDAGAGSTDEGQVDLFDAPGGCRRPG
jgi:hypothetical protein